MSFTDSKFHSNTVKKNSYKIRNQKKKKKRYSSQKFTHHSKLEYQKTSSQRRTSVNTQCYASITHFQFTDLNLKEEKAIQRERERVFQREKKRDEVNSRERVGEIEQKQKKKVPEVE